MAKKKTLKRIDRKSRPQHVPVEFDVDGDYISFIKNLRKALASHNNSESINCFKESKWCEPHILLPKEAPIEPARWIEIKLSTGEHKTTLFVRDDNVYLVGFENQKGRRYQASKGKADAKGKEQSGRGKADAKGKDQSCRCKADAKGKEQSCRGRGQCGGQSGSAPKKNEEMPDQILEGAEPLGFHLSYDDLRVEDSKWILGRISAREAVFKLSSYGTEENPNRVPQDSIKKHLVRLIVMICEAARMRLIKNRVEESWPSNDGALLTPVERETLNQWRSMSRAMMGWGTYTQSLKDILVENDKQASDVVRLIKYARTDTKVNKSQGAGGDDPSDRSPGGGSEDAPQGEGDGHGTPQADGSINGTLPGVGSSGGNGGDPPPAVDKGKRWQLAIHQQRQPQGRSLVEMCSIEVTEGCTLPGVSSITVFDGKRGQVIYWGEKDGDSPRLDSKGNLVLTGPYRAISADGTVAVRIITTVSDSDTEEEDLLIWDPYTEDHYDELVFGDTAKGLMLTYAVLRSAVEATVQVDVFLARETDFFGEISAHSKLANGEEVSVVLFSREIKDRVVFEPSPAGSTVPLTRSVLAWAVGSPLLIKVKSSHSVILSHNGLRLRTNVEHSFKSLEFSFHDQNDKICFDILQGFGHIRVSVDDTREYRKKSDSNSLPSSLDQLSRDQTLAAEQNTKAFGEVSSRFENWDDPTRMDILERELGAQDSMGPEDIRARPKLLVVRTSQLRLITFKHEMFITCLLHLTNNSNNQHVAFRCRSVLEDRHFRQYQSGHSSKRTWEFSGILPPNSTSAYVVSRQAVRSLERKLDALSLTLKSCVDEKHVDTIFPAAGEGNEKVTQSATVSEPADEATTSEQAEDDVGLDAIFGLAKEIRTEEVTLRTTTSEQAKGDEDLDTFFSRPVPRKGIKEATIKATVSHPADVPMTSKTETEIKVPITESSINQSDLDVYPLQLGFSFKQDKVICCPLRLTNRTDHYVIFKCLPYTTYSYLYTLDHLNGILPPRSTCTYFVAMEKQKDLPDDMDALSVILKSCKAEKIAGPGEYISSQDPMDGPIPPRIEIITVTGKDYEISSMDVHPTEPWILASHFNGNVSIWNYQTEARVMELTVSDSRLRDPGRRIYSAKFIAAEKWIVAGGDNGDIYMVKYMTKEVEKFQARGYSVESLAVHPNKPFVLSASYDSTIKLWNWDVNRDPIWQHTRTFRGHFQNVNYVMFNPYDNGNTFASASDDFTVKIWSTNDPNDEPKPIASLECGEVRPRHVAYYSMGGRQYMITGSLKQGAARVWDLEKPNKPIKELDGLAKEEYAYGCNVGVLNCGPDDINPVLITVSGDKGISFLDATTYKPRYDKVNFGLGVAMGFAVIDVKGKRSLAIALREGIAIMELNEDPVNSPATVEQAQEGIYSAESSNDQ